MAERSYPSSDLESGGEFDLANVWLKEAIYKEVSRGKKLRERKLGAPFDTTSKFSEPPTPARSISKDRRKPSRSPKRSNGLEQLRGRARSNSPFLSTRTSSTLSRMDSSTTSARRGRPVCSMRISELAVPTKRQCIDTWRNKSRVLPGQMVNRLKQQVMDQTPIVKISDAVNCFSQSSSVASKKRPPRKINKEAMISRDKEETQYISAIFGHKIAQKLIRPVNINLNSQLQNVSSIINGEICNILRDKTKLKTDVAIHERMVRETADKVTVWIANILDETSEKLLEEDLKELEEQEGPALDILDDLVDNVVTECGGAESDLEDKFNVSSIQKSADDVSTTDYISVSSGNNDDTDNKASSPVQEDLKEILDESDKKPMDDEESLKDHLMRQLNEIIDSNIIDTLANHDILEKLSKEFDKQTESLSNVQEISPDLVLPSLPDKGGQMDIKLLIDKEEYDREQISLENEQSPLHDALNQLDKADSESEKEAKFDETFNNENHNDTEETKASDKIDENKLEDIPFLLADDQMANIIDEQKLNIHEDQKSNIHEEQKSNMSSEMSEDRDKKVQFSYDNFGPLTEMKQSHSNEKLSGKANFNAKHGIHIGQSNDNILREVNEPWPEDLSFENLTKPGESVSKSVTSLGKILESDERNWLSPDEETFSGKEQNFHPHPESIEQFNNFGVNYEDFLVDDENNRNKKQSTALVEELEEFNRIDLNYVAKPKHDLEAGIKISTGENDKPYDPKEVITTINQEQIISQTADGTGISKSKPQIKGSVDQQELTAQIKGNELEASLNQLKQEIKKMNIQNESSEPSLVSVMLSKLQKHDDKLQDKTFDREQTYSDISKTHTAASERSKCASYPQKRKLNGKIYQRPLKPESMDVKKFDYRVHPSTAPGWIRRGRGQGDLGSCPRPQSYSVTNGMRERELEIRKRCKDLDKILMNLEKWKTWLEYITKYITSLKEKADLNTPKPRTNNTATSDRPKPPRIADKDVMWTKLNHRAKGGLKLYKNDDTIKFKISPTPMPTKYCFTCGKKQMKRASRSPTGK